MALNRRSKVHLPLHLRLPSPFCNTVCLPESLGHACAILGFAQADRYYAQDSNSSSSSSPTASSDPSTPATPITGAGQTGASQTGAGQTGPNSCTGVIPTWVFDTSTRQWQTADGSSFTCDMATDALVVARILLRQSRWLVRDSSADSRCLVTPLYGDNSKCSAHSVWRLNGWLTRVSGGAGAGVAGPDQRNRGIKYWSEFY